jgi:tetratricopeptide (TPR) repeat protein
LWALQEDKKGNYPAAIKYYTQALEINPELAPAYLGRAIIKSRYGSTENAIADGEKAKELFETQNNAEGYALSTRFIQLAQARSDVEENNGEEGNPQFVQIVNTVAPLLFKFFMPSF